MPQWTDSENRFTVESGTAALTRTRLRLMQPSRGELFEYIERLEAAVRPFAGQYQQWAEVGHAPPVVDVDIEAWREADEAMRLDGISGGGRAGDDRTLGHGVIGG